MSVRVNPDIFRAYDIRGVFGMDFDAAFAQRIGASMAHHLGNSIVVGRDERATSDPIAYGVIDGAVHAGANVIDVGVLSTPQFYWAIRHSGAHGGIMVTASHNPERDNGFKCVVRHDDRLEVIGGYQLRQIIDTHTPKHRAGGSVTTRDVVPEYADAVAAAAKWHGGHEIAASIDAPVSVRRVLERLAPIAPDDDLAVRFDRDGDRVQFFARGRAVPPDAIFMLLVEHAKLRPVVHDLRFSRSVTERLEALHVSAVRSAVGRLALTTAMHANNARLGAETSGHFYWREFGDVESPEYTFLWVYRLLLHERMTLEEMVRPYLRYAKSEELAVQVKDAKRARTLLERLEAHYREGDHDALDGLTVRYDDWWFNARPSNTEPLLRVVVEADNEKLRDAKVAEVMGLLAH
jgi:phosphomannomutase